MDLCSFDGQIKRCWNFLHFREATDYYDYDDYALIRSIQLHTVFDTAATKIQIPFVNQLVKIPSIKLWISEY